MHARTHARTRTHTHTHTQVGDVLLAVEGHSVSHESNISRHPNTQPPTPNPQPPTPNPQPSPPQTPNPQPSPPQTPLGPNLLVAFCADSRRWLGMSEKGTMSLSPLPLCCPQPHVTRVLKPQRMSSLHDPCRASGVTVSVRFRLGFGSGFG